MAVSTYGYMRRLALAAVAATALMGPANAFTIGSEPLGGDKRRRSALASRDTFGANLYATGTLSISSALSSGMRPVLPTPSQRGSQAAGSFTRDGIGGLRLCDTALPLSKPSGLD